MGRKKERRLDVFALQPGFGGFRREDIENLEEVLGHEISEELKDRAGETTSAAG